MSFDPATVGRDVNKDIKPTTKIVKVRKKKKLAKPAQLRLQNNLPTGTLVHTYARAHSCPYVCRDTQLMILNLDVTMSPCLFPITGSKKIVSNVQPRFVCVSIRWTDIELHMIHIIRTRPIAIWRRRLFSQISGIMWSASACPYISSYARRCTFKPSRGNKIA